MTRAEFPSLHDYLIHTLSESERRSVGLITFNQWSFALGAVCETALAAHAMGAEVAVGFWSGRHRAIAGGGRSAG